MRLYPYLTPTSHTWTSHRTHVRIVEESAERTMTMQNPIATLTMNTGRKIVIELRPDAAPNTVNSFIYLAGLGVFDGHAIQRIVPGFVVDASYSAFGREEAKYLIARETRQAGFPNNIRVEPGVICMGGYVDGLAGGEFFFPLAYHERLDGAYPAFGIVAEGLDEIRRWETVELVPVTLPEVPKLRVNEPKEPIVIESVTVETFGMNYPEPEKLENWTMPATW